MRRALGVLCLLQMAALAAGAQPAPPSRPAMSADCLAQARRILAERLALHDGVSKTGLQRLSGEQLATVQRWADPVGRLDGGSVLTPASSYQLLLLPGPVPADAADACPLHRAYVAFRQGGFNPQPAEYYGPLRDPGS